MKRSGLFRLLTTLALATGPAAAQPDKAAAPSPGEIAGAAPAADWIDIPADDLIVMTLSPDAKGRPRQVVLQLMPAPLAQGWVANLRTLTRAHWYDGTAIYRVQDNYVTQWGDPNEGEKAKKLHGGLRTMAESDYVYPRALPRPRALDPLFIPRNDVNRWTSFLSGFPVAGEGTPDTERNWPVHCYGSVGVARGQSPDTGDGSALYAVNGHAPRHLDRNIAVVGRVIEGMEYLSALPRGTEALGFYKDAADHVPILSARLASDLPAGERPHLQYLSTDSASFAGYAEARANRRDPFFLVPAGGADICNIPVPIRRRP
jgi:cyclophilin family peptidyl-prolyl cis-trans isomerase